MKTSWYRLVILLSLLVGAVLDAETVVIGDIEDRTGQLKPEILSAARDLLEQSYRATGKHQLLPAEQARRFVAGRKDRKCATVECHIAMGEALKADTVVAASVDFFAGIYTLTVSLVQVKAKQKVEGAGGAIVQPQ